MEEHFARAILHTDATPRGHCTAPLLRRLRHIPSQSHPAFISSLTLRLVYSGLKHRTMRIKTFQNTLDISSHPPPTPLYLLLLQSFRQVKACSEVRSCVQALIRRGLFFRRNLRLSRCAARIRWGTWPKLSIEDARTIRARHVGHQFIRGHASQHRVDRFCNLRPSI